VSASSAERRHWSEGWSCSKRWPPRRRKECGSWTSPRLADWSSRRRIVWSRHSNAAAISPGDTKRLRLGLKPFQLGASGAAVPIMTPKGDPIAAIAIGATEARLPATRLVEVIAMMQDEARKAEAIIALVARGAVLLRERYYPWIFPDIGMDMWTIRQPSYAVRCRPAAPRPAAFPTNHWKRSRSRNSRHNLASRQRLGPI
jgi:hypothetical protein